MPGRGNRTGRVAVILAIATIKPSLASVVDMRECSSGQCTQTVVSFKGNVPIIGIGTVPIIAIVIILMIA